MIETSQLAFATVDRLLDADSSPELAGLRDDIEFFARRRRGRSLLKPFLVRCGFELGGGNGSDLPQVALAVAELLNISSYQANAAFDHKYGDADPAAQYISATIVRELAGRSLSNLEGVSEPLRLALAERLSEVNRAIYIAQFIDLYVLRGLETLPDKISFADLYDRRCRHGSGELIAFCFELGYCLATGDHLVPAPLRHFALEYGTALHIVNDLADYLPPQLSTTDTHKGHQEAFSDFRLGKLTLPLYLLLSTATDEDRERVRMLGRAPLGNGDQRTIYDLMLRYDVFARVKRLTKAYYKRAKDYLHQLPASPARDRISLLASVLRTNKYFYAIAHSQECRAGA